MYVYIGTAIGKIAKLRECGATVSDSPAQVPVYLFICIHLSIHLSISLYIYVDIYV